MKSDFLIAITQLSAEKNLPKEVVIAAVESALVSAYRKDNFATNRNIQVKIDPDTGKVKVFAEKEVVERVEDSRREMSLAEAHKINPDAQPGDLLMVEATPANAGRIAAQTAKQVILQRLHEAEHTAIFEEYAHKEGDIVNGVVQRIEPKQLYIDLGRTEAVLPAAEQIRSERYRVGQRLRVYLLEVARTGKGPQVVVSRSHRDLVRRLFELEVPEVYGGGVEIKAIAREPGYRSKVAVAARQEGIDPVGCCVGLRGIRIQNIVNELGGEKIDVVAWSPEPAAFIASALSPSKVLKVRLDEKEGVATVIVPDKQLSLAIGKEGQNARLAARLTGWRIDIKSASAAEAEAVTEAEAEAKVAPEAKEEAAPAGLSPAEVLPEEPAVIEPELVSEIAGKPAAAVPETTEEPAPVPFEVPVAAEAGEIRFAEDILGTRPGAKAKKKKKTRGKEETEGAARPRKQRRAVEVYDEEDETY